MPYAPNKFGVPCLGWVIVTRAHAIRRPGARGTFSAWGPLCSYLNGELYEDLYERLYNKVLSSDRR
jgi:hypothetical protein